MQASRRSFRLLSLATLLVGATLLCSDALAKNDKWPPPESATSADVAKPELWPDDPDYGYKTGEKPADRKKGQWHLYGFQPERSPGAPPLRPDEVGKPSGVSVDLAWRLTTGDPRVKIAVLDSGIRWEERDVINKAYLNAVELKNHRPRTAAGEACGGEGELAGFDCNGDGVLSVADYADDPGLEPAAQDGHPRGDRNNNGVLDAGDLILNFSDGVDDDGNGYVDDISGWDFMMDDNDPYDDTRFGHGTGEAKYSTGEANNGIGSAGVCPQCRFIPLRVGDSFITDVQDFAQAVVYGVDNGASLIQEALGTINNSAFSASALAYAHRKGVLVVASMADENSKHHNMPATDNHTMPVHVIVNDGKDADPTTAKSFLAFNTCSNYGAQNFVSFPDDTCSSEATAQASGIAGLLYSAALKYGVTLTASEALQLFTMTADDIVVPESQAEGAPYYWSQKGFDQRFGYGRANAARMVEWVRDKKIPPEVDITRPTWFENLYKGRGSQVVDLQATVAAKRAASYDYVVEWAPGVQPLDEAFQVITEVKNVDGKTVSGEGAPLAQLDLSRIDPAHTPDRDSPFGENKDTITVRIRAVAHYGGDIGDVPGEMRRAYQVQTDPDLLPGFPIRIGSSAESSPKLADLDGDGKREIVLADGGGLIHAWKASDPPQELPGFPFKTKLLDGLEAQPMTPGTASYLEAPAYKQGLVDLDTAREGFVATAAVGDVNGDGKPEIVATTWHGTIYVIDTAGNPLPGWPVRMPYVPSCPLDPTKPKPEPCMGKDSVRVRGAFGSPVLADMNKDGKLDIIQTGFDGKVHIFDASGAPLPGWPVVVRYSGSLVKPEATNRVASTASVADLNGDGIPEVLVGSNEKLSEGSGAYYAIDGRGNLTPGAEPGLTPVLPNWPITIVSLNLFPLVAEGVPGAGAFADIDGDGVADAIFHGNATTPSIVPADPGKQENLNSTPPNSLPVATDSEGKTRRGLAPSSIFGDLSRANQPDTMLPLFAQPSVGDLDMDGVPDLITSGGSLSFAANLAAKGQPTAKPGAHLLGMWSGKTGKFMPGAPVPLEDYTFFNNQAIADITGDGYPEVMTGTGGYLVRAVDACGREAPGFPKNTGQWVLATVAVGDLDGDGKLEIVSSTRDGWLYAWHTQGKTDGVIQWESFHHDNHNSGNYATKLDQGVPSKTLPPLDCNATPSGAAGSGAASDAGSQDDGSCGCRAPGREPQGFAAALGLVALAGLALGRRRSQKEG